MDSSISLANTLSQCFQTITIAVVHCSVGRNFCSTCRKQLLLQEAEPPRKASRRLPGKTRPVVATFGRDDFPKPVAAPAQASFEERNGQTTLPRGRRCRENLWRQFKALGASGFPALDALCVACAQCGRALPRVRCVPGSGNRAACSTWLCSAVRWPSTSRSNDMG